MVGWEVGHAIHLMFTNPMETFLSTASARATYLSDTFLANTRIDVYEDNVTLVIGQPTATNGSLALAGRFATIGIADATIDEIGKWYSDRKIGGIYDMFGVNGNKIPIYSTVTPSSSDIHAWLYVQLGDK